MGRELHRTSELEKTSFLLILGAVTLMLAIVVWPFASALLWAALAAIMFQPLYRWVLKKVGGRRNSAALISLLIIFFAVLVPALWIGTLVVQEALQLVNTLQDQPINLSAIFDQIYAALPGPVQGAVDESGWTNLAVVQARLQEILRESAGLIAQQAVAVGGGALSFILSFTLALYVIFFLLRDGDRIGRTILHTAPIERTIADRLADRFLGIVRATIKGSGIVAIVQGALGTITLMIVGVPSALLFGVLMGIFSLVPVIGTVVVWGPVGIWLLFTQEIWQGVFVLVAGFVVISSADNVLRPILVGRDTGIPDWIILVTTLGGISLTGFSGIVLGPLVAGLFLASWSILKEQRDQENEALPDHGTNRDAEAMAPTKAEDQAEPETV